MTEETPEFEDSQEGINVFFEPPHWRPKDIEAELPNGERIPSELQFGGRRLGFPRRLPPGIGSFGTGGGRGDRSERADNPATLSRLS